MRKPDNPMVTSESALTSDAEAINYLKQAIASGKHWYLALLGAMGLWTRAEEVYNDRTYRYLIDGEAFDWLLLAERLCETVDGLLPETEKNNLLFHGVPPLELQAEQVHELIGEKKYHQYLNYFYGVTVEEALSLAVQGEIDKESRSQGLRARTDSSDEAFLRIYDTSREELLGIFRRERGYPETDTINLGELKEFTYWLFKYRLKKCEKARIASDTRKALEYLQRQWRKKGVFKVLAADFVDTTSV